MGKGGGGGPAPPTESTVVQSNLPEYVQPYFERLLERTESESKAAYTPFQGQRLATTPQHILESEQLVRDTAGAGITGLPAAISRSITFKLRIGSKLKRLLQQPKMIQILKSSRPIRSQ